MWQVLAEVVDQLLGRARVSNISKVDVLVGSHSSYVSLEEQPCAVSEEQVLGNGAVG